MDNPPSVILDLDKELLVLNWEQETHLFEDVDFEEDTFYFKHKDKVYYLDILFGDVDDYVISILGSKIYLLTGEYRIDYKDRLEINHLDIKGSILKYRRNMEEAYAERRRIIEERQRTLEQEKQEKKKRKKAFKMQIRNIVAEEPCAHCVSMAREIYLKLTLDEFFGNSFII